MSKEPESHFQFSSHPFSGISAILVKFRTLLVIKSIIRLLSYGCCSEVLYHFLLDNDILSIILFYRVIMCVVS
jgi:hypothetical protein